MTENVAKFYITEVDKYPDTVYCLHDRMEEDDVTIHSHKKGQFLYTEGGVVHIATPQKNYFLPARHYMWLPPNIQHSIHPSSRNVTMRNLYFPMEKDDPPFFYETGVYPVTDLLLQMVIFSNQWSGNITKNDKPPYQFTLALKYILPTVSLFNLPLALPYAKDKRLDEIINHMSGNLQEVITLPDLAHQFGLSERSLSRLFHKDVGMSFIQYLTIQRIIRALQLLLEENLSVKEVAAQIGYNSIPTFSTTFYKIVGKRPTDYVKMKNGLLD
jgi:AraC-like DNA-binding protein